MRTLSITVTDELYDRIKHAVPPRRISRFVSQAVEVKLKDLTNDLYKAYLAAAEDRDREEALKDWDAINIESWEESR